MVLIDGHIDLFGLKSCNGQGDAVRVLPRTHDIAGRVVILWFKAQAFIHQIEKAVKANARPPEGV